MEQVLRSRVEGTQDYLQFAGVCHLVDALTDAEWNANRQELLAALDRWDSHQRCVEWTIGEVIQQTGKRSWSLVRELELEFCGTPGEREQFLNLVTTSAIAELHHLIVTDDCEVFNRDVMSVLFTSACFDNLQSLSIKMTL